MVDSMKTLDKESELLSRFRAIPRSNIKYVGSFFSCLRIEIVTRSILFRKSWGDSSAKNTLPPDYHNDKHHIMMEMMRVDDCVGKVDNEHIPNSFEKETRNLKETLGNDYKKIREDVSIYFIPNSNISNIFTYEGYMNNFRRTILKHSAKIDNYKKNYPKCKKVIFFISDESNEFCEVYSLADKEKLEQGAKGIKVNWHIPYLDNKFIDIINECKCDYIIWFQHYKNFKRRKRLLVPRALIIDVKNFKTKGIDYNDELMVKVK